MGPNKATSDLNPDAFNDLARLVHTACGLKLVPEKIMMVQSRLRHRLRALDMSSFDAYVRLLCSPAGMDEKQHMISALTTNVSHFFREPHHFDVLTTAMRDEFRRRIYKKERIRIWSAGCSNGQEPYSIAMHLLGEIPGLADADFRILATDVDKRVIQFARRGQYALQQVSGIPEQHRRAFTHIDTADGQSVTIGAAVKSLISFQELNLISDWPMRHPFDAIFCRNVVIYFDAETQNRLWPRFANALRSDGFFFLGHSERVNAPDTFGFSSIGPTAYQRTGHSLPGFQKRGHLNGTA